MRKQILGLILTVVATSGLAADSQGPKGVWASGGVTYKHPRGYLVNRNCRLWVPARGEGQVVLNCQGYKMASSDFTTRTEEGRKIFIINFSDVPGAPDGTSAQYRGTYLRGSNKAIYYGDVFSQTESDAGKSDWTFAGGFKFSAPVVGMPRAAE